MARYLLGRFKRNPHPSGVGEIFKVSTGTRLIPVQKTDEPVITPDNVPGRDSPWMNVGPSPRKRHAGFEGGENDISES